MSPRKSIRRTAPLFLVVAVLALPFVAACGGSDPSVEAAKAAPEATPLDVATLDAQMSDISQTLAISGSLMPQTRVAVSPKMPGRLERVLVNIGDAVHAGQVVAALDAREINAQVDAAVAAVNVEHAALESAEAGLANATLEADRARNLFEKGAIPRQRLDQTETAHRSAVAQRDLARANVAQAEAAWRRAQEVRRDATLRSPLAGVVVERNYDAGNLVSPGDKPVVSVADTLVLKLEAGVGELDAGRLRVGMPARIEAQARPGVTFDGTLAAIAPEIDARNRHFQIEVRVPNGDATLLSGMYATAQIQTARATSAVVVPREAVSTRDGRRVVLRVEKGRIQPTRVVEGISDGARVQIVSGLSAGDAVLADARKPLPAGTKVRAIPIGANRDTAVRQ
jgi:RND family efflux transporter MFP subunit